MNRYADRCIRHQVKQSTCDECMRVCPASAISWNGEIQIDAEACQDCGLCRSACRQDVFQHETYKIQYPTLRAGQKGFSCRNAALLEGIHRLPCLGMLDETELVASAVTNGLADLELHFGPCETCGWKQGRQQALEAVGKAERLLKGIGREHSVVCYFSGDKTGTNGDLKPSINRRDFFYMGLRWLENASKKQAAKKVDQVVVHLLETQEAGRDHRRIKKLPLRRSRLLQILQVQEIPVTDKELPVLSSNKQISQACDQCQLCIETCPTGALFYRTDEQTGTIWFSQHLCTDCSGCIDVCPKSAIANDQVEAAELPSMLLLNQQAFLTCAECGGAFVTNDSGEERCPLCQNRNDLIQSIWA